MTPNVQVILEFCLFSLLYGLITLVIFLADAVHFLPSTEAKGKQASSVCPVKSNLFWTKILSFVLIYKMLSTLIVPQN